MKIVIGYDGSAASKAALELGIKHAKSFNAKLELVYSTIQRVAEDVLESEEIKKEINQQCQRVGDLGIACEAHILNRDLEAGEDLVAFATENQVDEIVIGIKKRSKLEKIISGSHAQYIVLHAPCPVVTVK